ncbi:MAG: DUF2934 domain-containing protein [Acidobacteriota bacterium]
MKETIEQIRQRLLNDGKVNQIIQQRAYEIWLLRGRQIGRDREDWLLAENEVLNFFVEQELKNADESEAVSESVEEAVEVEVVATPVDISPEPIVESEVVLVATPIEEKKPRKRATTPRKPRAVKEGAEKKPAAKKLSTAKKTTGTRKTSGKKSANPEAPIAD